MTQIAKDARFLAKLNIMDYSLLIGIHDRDKRGEPSAAPIVPTVDVLTGGGRSKIPFRRSMLSQDVIDGTAMVAKATEDIERMVYDLSIDGIGLNKRSEVYGDLVEESDTVCCFGSLSNNPEEEVDLNDIHCDEGDSDLDENWEGISRK